MPQPLWIPIVVSVIAVSLVAVTDLCRIRAFNVLAFPLMAGGLMYYLLTAEYDGQRGGDLTLLFALCVLMVPYLVGLVLGACERKRSRKDSIA